MSAAVPVPPEIDRLDLLLAALREHYGELVRHVRQHAARLGGDPHCARDVVHDLCVELIAAPPAQPVHTPLAFLREMSRRRAIDHYRRQATQARWIDSCDTPPDVADAGSFGCDPVLALASRQALRQLVAAIEALPPRCRDVFVLCRIHEYTQPATAEYLGISLKTVEKHLRLGLAACRKALAETR